MSERDRRMPPAISYGRPEEAIIMNDFCILCNELTNWDEPRGQPILHKGVYRYPHKECALREVVGGIGHLEDHQYWCVERNDPDAGKTYRKSAIAVWQWVLEHGTEAAADKIPPRE